VPSRRRTENHASRLVADLGHGVMVQVSGFVRSQADIDKAVQVAGAIADVRSVKKDTRVK
jgi:osmotically-inducible protein OsmY